MSQGGKKDRTELIKDALLKEYEFVESLIPLYRQFQMQLVRYGFLVYAAALALFAAGLRTTALLSASRVSSGLLDSLVPAVLAVVPFAVAFLLFAFATTEARIKRASSHVTAVLAPKIEKLLGSNDLFTWEKEPGSQLNRAERFISTSTPLILTLSVPALFSGGWYLWGSSTHPLPKLVAWLGLTLVCIAGGTSLYISIAHETRSAPSQNQPRNPQSQGKFHRYGPP